MRRGSPLALLAVVMSAWIGGRALTWENPFPRAMIDLPGADLWFAENLADRVREAVASARTNTPGPFVSVALTPSIEPSARRSRANVEATSVSPDLEGVPAEIQYGHHLLWLQALGTKHPLDASGPLIAIEEEPDERTGISPTAPPLEEQTSTDRWAVDVWGFWREGSNAAAISQGRVPIYGASQVGAKLEWRPAASSDRDPRLFARVYRAMVDDGESELAIGASVRPVGSLPVRLAVETRVTETLFGTKVRPAAMAITELPVQNLPAGFRLEAYAGAGYVGGEGATAFADGQASVTRQVVSFDGPSISRARVSVGAGAWGGAQEDASRIDVGPTVRLDLTIGEVPARLSVDWRERVGGEAAPGSGVAATLSTRF